MEIRHLTLLFCLLTDFPSAGSVITTVGTTVVLTCTYDAKYYGPLSVCWGRGAIPNSGCGNQVIKADGTSVVSRLSERYVLRGNLGQGDVSLTILQAVEADSGIYGCRVDIPGWFNDQKQEVTLTVKPGRPFPLKLESREVRERTITVSWTSGFDGGRAISAYIIDLKNKYASWDSAIRTEITHPHLTQATLVDLRPWKTYNIRMFAVNSVGMSDGSNVLILTTKEAAPEGPPEDMRLEALTSHTIRVSWKPPRADLINGVLRGYSVNYRAYDPVWKQFQKWQHVSVPPTVESIVLENLKPSTQYGVLVQAKTNAGMGPASNAPLCSTLEEVPETTTISSSSPNVVIHWISHTDRRPVQKTETTSASNIWKVTTTTIIPALPSSTAEAFSSSSFWDQTTLTIMSVHPDPPVVEVKEVKDNTFSLSWTPGLEGDRPITGYCLEYKAANASWDYTKAVVDFGPNQTEATIIEINPSTYNLRMFAKSSVGKSKASNVLTITTGEAGHPLDALITSTQTEDFLPTEEVRSVHPAAIVVPVVLVLIGAMATIWQLRRIRQKTDSLNLWLTNGAIRYRHAEPLQEL
ncbi:Down syndrome cell adhesion molecule homolog isoform X2 [Oryzias latipes]|uniref:Down syndrome cell adhesion molecule homolog isoform X2 n=1 Tax=Oryzias latipes TaxID=8090 RepID=UPI0005CC097E|nr:Down syndrome cell adhesion molecule homolog isoform X2 [Oryzias latipes]